MIFLFNWVTFRFHVNFQGCESAFFVRQGFRVPHPKSVVHGGLISDPKLQFRSVRQFADQFVYDWMSRWKLGSKVRISGLFHPNIPHL